MTFWNEDSVSSSAFTLCALRQQVITVFQVKHEPWSYIYFTWFKYNSSSTCFPNPRVEEESQFGSDFIWPQNHLWKCSSSALNLFFGTEVNTRLFAICVPQPFLNPSLHQHINNPKVNAMGFCCSRDQINRECSILYFLNLILSTLKLRTTKPHFLLQHV